MIQHSARKNRVGWRGSDLHLCSPSLPLSNVPQNRRCRAGRNGTWQELPLHIFRSIMSNNLVKGKSWHQMPSVNDLDIVLFQLTNSSRYETVNTFSQLRCLWLHLFVKTPRHHWHACSSLPRTSETSYHLVCTSR